MIKMLIVGLWVCAASLGSSYVVASMQAPKQEGEVKPTYFAGLDWRKTEGITIPVLANETITGYVLARFVYTIDGETADKLSVPPDPFILNDAFSVVYEASDFDFQHPEKYDLEALKTRIKDSVNKRYDKEIVHEILVEQFDFLPKEDMNPRRSAAN